MIYLSAVIVGFGSGLLVVCLTAYLEKHTYDVRVKEIKKASEKENVAQDKSIEQRKDENVR